MFSYPNQCYDIINVKLVSQVSDVAHLPLVIKKSRFDTSNGEPHIMKY